MSAPRSLPAHRKAGCVHALALSRGDEEMVNLKGSRSMRGRDGRDARPEPQSSPGSSGFGFELGPDCPRMIAQRQGFFPTVRELISVGARHRVFRRSELAEEVESCIGFRAVSPFAEARLPPAEKKPQPLLVLRKAKRELDLLARCNTALERTGAMQDAADPFLAFGGDRPGELAADDIVGEIGRDHHLGNRVEQMQGGEQVVGYAVAVRLELYRDADLLRDVDEAADHRYRTLDGDRHHLADDIDERRADFLRRQEDGPQRGNRLRESDQDAAQPITFE